MHMRGKPHVSAETSVTKEVRQDKTRLKRRNVRFGSKISSYIYSFFHVSLESTMIDTNRPMSPRDTYLRTDCIFVCLI